MGVLQQVGAGGGAAVAPRPMVNSGGGFGVNRIAGGGAYNPAVANTAGDVQSYRRNFGHQWLKANPGGDPGDFESALQADPTFQKLTTASRGAQQAHVEGTSQPAYDQLQAAIQYLTNSAGAVSTDAGSRRVAAQGTAARDVGQGNLYNAQAYDTSMLTGAKRGALEADTARNLATTPGAARQANAQGALTEAQAGNVAALTPAQVAAQQAQASAAQAGADRTRALIQPEAAGAAAVAGKTRAETGAIEQDTKLRPEIVRATQALAGQDRDLQQQKTRSEIVKNLRDPITGEVSSIAASSPAGSAGATAPAAAAPAPPDRGMFGRVMDSLAGAYRVGGAAPVAERVMNALTGGGAAPVSAPMAQAPTLQRRQLPDGRIIEVSPDGSVNQVMPDGTRRLLKVTQ
jgi:hypothetical protein